MVEVIEIHRERDLRAAWPVMRDLRPHLDEDSFVQLVQAMRPDGYRLFALQDDTGVLALAGLAVCTNLYDLRHLWVYDLVTASDRRAEGHGEALLAWVEDFARSEHCGRIALASGVQRLDAHRFYEQRMGYSRVSHVFSKAL